MGKLAKVGISGGRKVSLRANRIDPIDSLSQKLLGGFGFLHIAEKITLEEDLNADEIALLLARAPYAVLLKLHELACKDRVKKSVILNTLNLPLEKWLRTRSPAKVIDQCIKEIDQAQLKPDQVVLGIEDFSDIEFFWSAIVAELMPALPENVKIIGPSPDALLAWVENCSGARSDAECMFEFERKLARLKETGLSELLPCTNRNLLKAACSLGFSIHYCTKLDGLDSTGALARELERVRDLSADGALCSSWLVGYLEPATLQELSLSFRELRAIRAALVASLVLRKSENLSVHPTGVSTSLWSIIARTKLTSEIWCASNASTARLLHLPPPEDSVELKKLVSGKFL